MVARLIQSMGLKIPPAAKRLDVVMNMADVHVVDDISIRKMVDPVFRSKDQ
jgi:hypothetical protein